MLWFTYTGLLTGLGPYKMAKMLVYIDFVMILMYNLNNLQLRKNNKMKEDFMVKERSIALAIVLSFVTCGIYAIYWFVVLTDDLNQLSDPANQYNETSGIVAFLLTLITCGIYGLYWAYKQGEKIDRMKQSNSSPGILYLILWLLTPHVIAYALMQNEINKYVSGYNNPIVQ